MIRTILFVLLLPLAFACNNDRTTTKTEGITPESSDPQRPEEPTTSVAPTVLQPWVDQLNMRDKPSTSGKVIAKLPIRSELTVTGNESDREETIVLRGVAYTDRWYEVMTTDDQTGWVFGGAVRHPDEIKGNKEPNDQRIDFPIFGVYDLTKWELTQPTTTTTGGDATTETTIYKDDTGQRLTIEKTSVGEYGYSERYVVESGQDFVKVRELDFTVDLDGNNQHELTETVDDYLNSKRYVRSQTINKHFMQLNARPRMARGAWTIEPLTGTE